MLTVEKAQKIASIVGRVVTRAGGFRAHLFLSMAATAGNQAAVDGLKSLRGALLVLAAEVAGAIDAVDAELCRHAALEPEPLQVVGARAVAAEERRRRRMAAS